MLGFLWLNITTWNTFLLGQRTLDHYGLFVLYLQIQKLSTETKASFNRSLDPAIHIRPPER